MSQADLGREMGEIQPHISDMEKGKRISLNTLYRLQEFYQIPMGMMMEQDFRENSTGLVRYLLDKSVKSKRR